MVKDRITGLRGKDTSIDSDLELDSEPELTIGIPGGKAIFGSDTPPFRRILWVTLASACLVSAIVQVQDRVSRYLKIPTRKEVSFDRNDTLTFPWVTICAREPFNYTTMETLRPLAAEKLKINASQVKLPHDLVTLMPLDQLWRNIRNEISVMAIECWFGRGKQCSETGAWYEVMTILGPCFQYRVREPLRETGLFNGLYMQMDGFKLPRPSKHQTLRAPYADGWRFMVHSERYQPVLDLGGKGGYMMPDSSLDVRIILKKATALDLKRRPCNDSLNYSIYDCKLNCMIEDSLANVGCLLPFMIRDNKEEYLNRLCNSPDQYKRAREFLRKLDSAVKHDDCKCMEPCRTSEYLANQEKVLADVKPRRLRFRVFFQDTSFEQEIEEREYSLIGLFCDIGNSIGLLLGASVLTLAEAIEWGVLKCVFVKKFIPRVLYLGKRRIYPQV